MQFLTDKTAHCANIENYNFCKYFKIEIYHLLELGYKWQSDDSIVFKYLELGNKPRKTVVSTILQTLNSLNEV